MRGLALLTCVFLVGAACSTSPEHTASSGGSAAPDDLTAAASGSSASADSDFCADTDCRDVKCTAGTGTTDDFFGDWGAHKFFLHFSRDLKGSSSLGILYTDD